MTRVLMVETDARLISAVGRVLSQKDVEVCAVDRIERARELAERERFALLLIDSNLVSERDLSAFAGTPIVITAAFLERDPAERFARAARVLLKPFTSAELSQVIDDELGPSHEDDSLLDLLSRGHASKSSFALSVGAGRLVLERGELVDATLAEKRGEAALVEILSRGGAVKLGVSGATARTISRPFRPLLFDALSALEKLDETRPRRILRSLPGGQR